MPSTRSLRLGGLQRLLFVVVCFWCFLLVSWTSLVLPTFQASKSLPFGIFSFTPNGPLYAQDFAYNMLYFQGIHERLVAHPYRLADQESLMRQMLPQLRFRPLSHAYSPVAYALALPLLHVSGYHAYLAYIILSSIGIVLLFYFYLLPRTQSSLANLCARGLPAQRLHHDHLRGGTVVADHHYFSGSVFGDSRGFGRPPLLLRFCSIFPSRFFFGRFVSSRA